MRARPVLAALVLALPAALAAQTPRRPPTFEAGIEVVNLHVTVMDGRNRYVTDLGEGDFSIFEDGIKQDLTLFNHEDLPISLSLMLDMSASMDEKLTQAQQAAIRFVKTLRTQDVASIVAFNDRINVLSDFSADHAVLEKAVMRTEASGPTALHNALYVTLKELGRQKKAGELRRRALVLLSDGEDTASLVQDEQVMELARKLEIAIYAISLRPNRVQDRNRLSFSQAAHLLTVLSRDTGGQVYFPNSLSELDAVYDRIAEELRTQYNLGYVSSNRRRDGKWRRIVVRTREALQVRHKIGYYAPRGDRVSSARD
ncbi:MAG TPA: VWA domain-containing protein [Vicinamibacteria bacterium]|nr:VWA domain-containing protein [Vicinamibacteria bacterium]